MRESSHTAALAGHRRVVRSGLRRAQVLALWTICMVAPFEWAPLVPYSVWSSVRDIVFALFVGLSITIIGVRVLSRRGRAANYFRLPSVWLTAVLALGTAVGIGSSAHPGHSAAIWARFVIALVFLIGVVDLSWRDANGGAALEKSAKIFVFGGTIGAAVSIAGVTGLVSGLTLHGNSLPIGGVDGGWMAGFTTRYNAFSWFLAVIFPFGLWFGLVSRAWFARAAWGCAATLIVLGAVASGGRGGLVAMVVSSAFLYTTVFSARGRSFGRRAKVAALASLLLIGCAVVLLEAAASRAGLVNPFARLARRVGPGAGAGVYAWDRLHIWRLTVSIALRHSWIGIGLDQLRYFLVPQLGFGSEAHNMLLECWSEAGIIGGLTAAAWVIGLTATRFRRLLRERAFLGGFRDVAIPAAAATIVGVLSTVVENGLPFVSLELYVPFWIAVALSADLWQRRVAWKRVGRNSA